MSVSELMLKLEEYFKEIEIVNTITFENDEEVDYNKANIYPLVNIEMIRVIPLDTIDRFIIKFIVLQQRDIKPRLSKDNKRFGNNFIDNYNETFEIASIFISKLRYNQDIEILGEPDVVFINKDYTNILDGVEFTLTVEVDSNVKC